MYNVYISHFRLKEFKRLVYLNTKRHELVDSQ